jgi:short-subunit dehydrogenase
MDRDTNAWALVTGASSGLGKAIAELLARKGRKVILVGRDVARLEAVRAGLDREGAAIAIRRDLSLPGAAEALHDECMAGGYEVELLVNNAGVGAFGESVGLAPDKIAAMIALNVTALTQLCASFGAGMRARGHGSILNVGSFAGGQPTPYFASYAATKSYVLYYSLALRAEMAPCGVGVTCLLPGYVRTAFDGNAGTESPGYLAFSDANAMEAEAVARVGLRALEKGKAWAIAGTRNKLAARLFSLMPRSAVPFVQKAFLDKILGGEASA